MYQYTTMEALAKQPSTSVAESASSRNGVGSPIANEQLSFVVDLGELGLRAAYRAHEIHRGSQCLIFARVGPEYVNPWSGHSEQANWIL